MELMHWIIAIMSIALACIELIVIAYLFRVAWLGRQETKRLAAQLHENSRSNRGEE
ncbi:hypothetical protein ACUXZ5_00685 [Alloscardovia omnicolens]|uniref:hypothetical protein n=1 Tax=Alloscardovia omnicolens TaxID=419015 RepID=UPI000AD9A784|nr:hypothetical protein [Alloscardovia omnicolens]MDK6663299.1 hypothetical protein [Alloscardovia omnicolens]MDK7747209.1 hypothetical protein [Alloscardovia omnicolens]